METISLNGTWALRGNRQDWLPLEEIALDATVPGCVQLDLSANGYLPADLFMGENIKEAQKYDVPVVVELEPLKNYYSAEAYHQDYLENNPDGYCHLPLELFEFARRISRKENR